MSDRERERVKVRERVREQERRKLKPKKVETGMDKCLSSSGGSGTISGGSEEGS